MIILNYRADSFLFKCLALHCLLQTSFFLSACINSLQPFVVSHRETKKEVTFQKKLLISRYVVVEDIKMTPYSVQMLDIIIQIKVTVILY